MRRYVYILLFVVVLVAPFAVRRVVATGERSGGAAAADAPELVVVTPHNQDIRRAFAAAFSDWHRQRFGTPVRVTYLAFGGTNDIARALADQYRRFTDAQGHSLAERDVRVSIDVAWGGGDVAFNYDFRPYLKPVALPPGVLAAAFPTPDLNGVPLYEKAKDGGAPRWVGVALSSFGIVYSPPLYATLKLPEPQRWADLDGPELAGLVALADPTRSGSVAAAYMVQFQRAMADAESAFLDAHPDVTRLPPAQRAKAPGYDDALAAGWRQGLKSLTLAAANARYFTDSASQVPNDVANGDAAAGVAIDFYGRVVEEAVGSDRIRYVAPRGATAITPDPVGILYGVTGDRAALANRFVEFLLTPDAQRLWNLNGGASPYVERSLRRLPIRRDVYADRRGWADDTNPFEEAGSFNQRGEWGWMYSDLRPLEAAAWIDSRTALKDAYATVLAVPDPDRRRQLIDALAELPVTLADVRQQNARRKAIDAGKDPQETDSRLWMAKQRLAWAQTFRAHYAKVAASAD